MDTTKTNGTAQRKNRAGTRTNLLKFMFFLFALHAIITFLSHGTGVVETFRTFLIHVFWPPESWAGETLPVHQQLVHAYVKPTDRYRNAPATGRFVAPKPSFCQKLNAKRRLLKLKKQSVYQVATLCQRQQTACLAEVLSDNFPNGSIHLIHDLSASPKWLFGHTFPQIIPSLLRELSLSQDRNGKIGLYYKKDVFLQTVPRGTFWAFLNQEGKLCLRNTKPDQTTRNVIQIRISQG